MASITDSILAHYHHVLDAIATHPRQTAITTSAVAVTLSVAWVVSDFHAWRAFGTGGTPPTWAGYWRMTKLRVNRALLFGADDLADASPLSATSGPQYLDANTLPARDGPRPKIMARTMPQRQVPYAAGVVPPDVVDRVANMMGALSMLHDDLLDLRASKTEGGSTEAIYAKSSLTTLSEKARADKLLACEIAHAHPAEGSLHVWLSEADAKIVVEKGWGLRFPLKFVDKGWTMVYAPRTTEEADVAEKIVKAGISFITGVKV